MNGNGNGTRHSGGSSAYLSKRLAKLYEFHHTRAEALRLAIELIGGAATASKAERGRSVLSAAIALDAARAARVKQKSRKPRKGSHGKGKGDYAAAARIARREASAALLAALDRTEARAIHSRAIGSLVRRGYVIKRRDGYIRTAKEYVV